MKQFRYLGAAIVFLASLPVPAHDNPEPLRCKIIKKQGIIQLWSKTSSERLNLENSEDLESGKTLILQPEASLHLTFEPLIDLLLQPATTLSFENLLIERTSRIIRFRSTLQTGAIILKAPPQSGHTLLFSLQTPSAVIDVTTGEISVTVDPDGTTTVEVANGSAKILPHESTLKTQLNGGSRGVIVSHQSTVQISGIGDAAPPGKKTQHKQQPSIAILSVKSKTIPKENLEHISNTVAQEFSKSTEAKVLFLDEIKRLLHSEGYDRLLDCFSDSCISSIGARAGVDIVIVGNLGQLGSTHILDLKMVDVLRDRVIKRTSVSAAEDLGLILGEIPGAIQDLVKVDTVLTSVLSPPGNMEPSSTGEYREKEVWLFPGKFRMGSASTTGEIDELPGHTVALNGFFIDRFEVTRDEFEKVMGYKPAAIKGCGNCPVTNVTWLESMDYCGKAGKKLPSEAQWEYACRAGTITPFSTGSTISADQANFNAQKPFGGSPAGTFRGKVVPVGMFPANAWRLHDMHGNAAEWCRDWYDIAYYGNSPQKNPTGPEKGTLKTVRGGSWSNDGNNLRSSNRTGYNPELRLDIIGFRCVREDSTLSQ